MSGGWGGAENVVFNLIKTIEQQGHHVSIILNDETYPYFKDLNNVTIYNIGPVFTLRKIFHENFHIKVPKFFLTSKKFSKIIKTIVNPLIFNLNYLKIQNKTLKTIDEIHPDIIHFHNPVVLQFCSYLISHITFPIIYTSHGIDFGKKQRYFSFLKAGKKRRVLNQFDKITAVSNYVKQELISNKVTSEIKVIYNGIDGTLLENILKNNPQKNNSKEYTLLFPGGQKTQKGGQLLLQAIKMVNTQHQDVKLYYCGYVTSEFKKQHQNKNIIFTGSLPHNEFLRILSQSDCLTLLSESEGFSIAILEAMSLGKTILCTSAGGIPEQIIDGVNGFFVEKNPQKIAEKIIFLLQNPDMQTRISKNNIRDIKKFQWDTIVNQYLKMYESIIRQ